MYYSEVSMLYYLCIVYPQQVRLVRHLKGCSCGYLVLVFLYLSVKNSKTGETYHCSLQEVEMCMYDK